MSRKAQTKRAEFDAEVERQSFELAREPQVGDVVLSRGEQAVFVRFLPDGGCILRLRDGNGDHVKEQQFESLYGNEPGSAHLTMPPLLVKGDAVVAHGDRAELTSILPNGGCILTFSAANSHSQQRTYRWCFGKAEGSARLHRSPPLLLPAPRAQSSLAVPASTRLLVREHAKVVCPTSPCRRDEMKRHIAPRVWESRQALILQFPLYTLCALFMLAHPGLLRESQYRVVVHEEVWELKHAYRETCLCRTCFNLRCYREALKVLYQILLVIAQADAEQSGAPDEADAADEANLQEHPDACAAAPDPKLQKLITFCESSPGRRGKVTELICADSLDDADAKCIRQECPNCPSFHRMWSAPSTGLRCHLVDSHGLLKQGASPVWSQQWSRIKSGGDGSSKEDDLRQKREGTVIQLLDEFEPVQKVNVRHQFHIDQSRAAESDFLRHSIPGMIDCKSDYSENARHNRASLSSRQLFWSSVRRRAPRDTCRSLRSCQTGCAPWQVRRKQQQAPHHIQIAALPRCPPTA